MHRIPTLHLPCAEKNGEQNPLGTEKDSKGEKKKLRVSMDGNSLKIHCSGALQAQISTSAAFSHKCV